MFPYGSEGKDIFARPNCASSSQSKGYCVCWIFIIETFVLVSRWNARELLSSLPFHVSLVLFSLSSSQLEKVSCFAFKSKFTPKNHNNRPIIPSTTTNTYDRHCKTRNSIARHVSLKKSHPGKQTNKQTKASNKLNKMSPRLWVFTRRVRIRFASDEENVDVMSYYSGRSFSVTLPHIRGK